MGNIHDLEVSIRRTDWKSKLSVRFMNGDGADRRPRNYTFHQGNDRAWGRASRCRSFGGSRMGTGRRIAAQERGQVTQMRVVEGAADLFATQGYVRTSLPEIASQSGASTGSIYFHFASKALIAEAVLEEQHRRSIRVVEEIGASHDSTIAKLIRISRAMTSQIASDSVVGAGIRLALTEEGFEQAASRFFGDWAEAIARLVEPAIGSGELRSRLNAAQFADAFTAQFTCVQFLARVRPQRHSLAEHMTWFWLAQVDSLVPPDRVEAAIELVHRAFGPDSA